MVGATGRADADLPASIAAALGELRARAGSPSYQQIALRISAARQRRGLAPGETAVSRSTVYDCFRPGRSRLNAPLVLEIAAALDADEGTLGRWREALVERQRAGTSLVVRVDEGLPDPPLLIGRDDLVDQLAGGTGNVVVSGMPGVGKTALALAVAVRIAPRFDRVLRVNLDGFTEGRIPPETATVLDGLLRCLLGGPAAVGDPLQHYRDLLSARRVLLVLDNAAGPEQVAELLPPGDASVALVTSRVEFPEAEGLTRARLPALPAEAAALLLATVSGRPSGVDDADLHALAATTGGLPLALTLLGRRVREHPDWPLADHRDAHEQRLRLLALDDGLHGSLAQSYAALDPDAAAALRLLALAPGTDLGDDAARELLGAGTGDGAASRTALEGLATASLVSSVRPGRWELHDLVRRFARRMSLDVDPPSTLAEAGRRLLEHYLAEATRAVAVIYPRSIADWYWPHDTAATTDEVGALDWLGEEQANLVHAVTWAAEAGWDELTVRLATVLWAYLADRSEAATNLVLQRHALAAAERAGDALGVSVCRRNLGQTLGRLGRPDEAGPMLEEALAASEALGDRLGVVQARNALANVVHMRGDNDEAVRLLAANVEDRRAAADVHLTNALLNLGVVLTRMDRSEEALARLQEAGALAETQAWVAGEQLAANNVTTLLQEAGRIREAEVAATRALRLARRLRRPRGIAYATSTLASVRYDLGDLDEAMRVNDEALRLAREVGVRELEAMTLSNAGDYLRATRPDLAREHYLAARVVAEQIGNVFERDRAAEALHELDGHDGPTG
ncbi:tetratricopeptide repeat protein [Nocardioides humi]|uniref:Tetratricopeptide repeat protein n=1 Tax=Nocardioides humi TaxID=449461 RepID=A0ABN1ZTR0_9ACTN|nr:tetratricopeptide repeat protein [Nocardioides humi]